MEDIRRISYSELSSYMECPRKHHYAYEERLHKISYSQSSRMNIGIVVHECIEESLMKYLVTNYTASIEDINNAIEYRAREYSKINKPEIQMVYNGDGFVPGNLNELEQWDRDIELAVKITKRTMKYLDVPSNWRTKYIEWNNEKVPLIEFKFEYPIIPGYDLVGKIDWVAESLEDGQTYLIDWKTRKIFSDDFEVGGEDMNLQLSLYQYVLNSLGVDTFGTITYQIRSDIPHLPVKLNDNELKDGTLVPGKISKAKITTDYETFKKALEENGESPEEEISKIKWSFTDDTYWWLPIQVIRGKKELHSRWETAREITERLSQDDVAPKYENPRCTFCPYFRLCLGEDRGFDIDFLKESQYTTESRLGNG